MVCRLKAETEELQDQDAMHTLDRRSCLVGPARVQAEPTAREFCPDMQRHPAGCRQERERERERVISITLAKII